METTCKIDEDIAAVAKNMTDILLLQPISMFVLPLGLKR